MPEGTEHSSVPIRTLKRNIGGQRIKRNIVGVGQRIKPRYLLGVLPLCVFATAEYFIEMCCVCSTSRNTKQMRRKVLCARLLSAGLLSVTIFLFYISTVASDVPWFSLYLVKNANKRVLKNNHGGGGGGAHFLSASRDDSKKMTHHLDHSKKMTHHLDHSKKMTHHHSRDDSKADDGSSDWSSSHGSSSRPWSGPYSTGHPEDFKKMFVDDDDGGANNVTEPLIKSVWSLRMVRLTIPRLRMTDRKLRLQDLAKDPLISTALSLSGVYDAVVDTELAAQLVRTLGVWATIWACLALMAVVLLALLEYGCKKYYQQPLLLLELRQSLLRSNGAAADDDDDARGEITTTTTEAATRRNPSSGLSIRIPWKLPFTIVGILSLVSGTTACLGLAMWATRSLHDANRILLAIGHLVGPNATDWILSHTVFYVNEGLLENAAAATITLSVALFNLLVEFRVKPPIVCETGEEVASCVVAPPVPNSSLRERVPTVGASHAII